MVKLVTINAFFPELKGGNAFQEGKGEGSNWPLATYRALKDLAKQIKGKHVTCMKLEVSIINKKLDNSQ